MNVEIYAFEWASQGQLGEIPAIRFIKTIQDEEKP